MKTLRWMALLAMMLGMAFSVKAEKKNVKTVLYHVNLHCEACKAKIEKNIPYEKGVKDLLVDLEGKTVKVSFREDKNTTEGIRKAIEKLNFQVDKTEEIKAGEAVSGDTGKKDGKKE